jgi:hypothetical protein
MLYLSVCVIFRAKSLWDMSDFVFNGSLYPPTPHCTSSVVLELIKSFSLPDHETSTMGFGRKKGSTAYKRKRLKVLDEDDDTTAVVTVETADEDVTASRILVRASAGAADYKDNSDSEDEGDKSFEFNETPADDYLALMAERSEPLLGEDAVRLSVAYLFITQHDALEDRAFWGGKSGVRKNIRDRLGISENTKIDHILLDVLACKKAGISYRGERQVGDAKAGRPPFLAVDSVEAQIIADSLESGGSIPTACWLANQHRKEIGAESICIAPVRNLVKRLAPSVEKIKKRAQGSALSTSIPGIHH